MLCEACDEGGVLARACRDWRDVWVAFFRCWLHARTPARARCGRTCQVRLFSRALPVFLQMRAHECTHSAGGDAPRRVLPGRWAARQQAGAALFRSARHFSAHGARDDAGRFRWRHLNTCIYTHTQKKSNATRAAAGAAIYICASACACGCLPIGRPAGRLPRAAREAPSLSDARHDEGLLRGAHERLAEDLLLGLPVGPRGVREDGRRGRRDRPGAAGAVRPVQWRDAL